MTKSVKTERRKHPRVDRELPIKVAANGYDFITSTQNISCTGAYCRINKYMPPFTKVKVRLNLPINHKDYAVDCKGVVVRTEDEDGGGFNIAIYFNEINNEQRKKISQYISQLLPEKAQIPCS